MCFVTFALQCEYSDSIEFQCKEGTFKVNLRAVMLHHSLELPDSVQLPLCAVHHSTNTSFLFCNARYGDLSLNLKLKKIFLRGHGTFRTVR